MYKYSKAHKQGMYRIPRYPRYWISRKGDVFSEARTKFIKLKLDLSVRGYACVRLYQNGPKKLRVHRLVAKMFIPNPKRKLEINHKNGIRNDNRVANLEWCTHLENQNHAIRTGLRDKLPSNTRRTKQYLKGKLINVFPSVRRAADATNQSRSNVLACCSGRYKQAGGFTWKFA